MLLFIQGDEGRTPSQRNDWAEDWGNEGAGHGTTCLVRTSQEEGTAGAVVLRGHPLGVFLDIRDSCDDAQSLHHGVWHTEFIERCLVVLSLFLPQPVRERWSSSPFHRQRTQGSKKYTDLLSCLHPKLLKEGETLCSVTRDRERAWVSKPQGRRHSHWMSVSQLTEMIIRESLPSLPFYTWWRTGLRKHRGREERQKEKGGEQWGRKEAKSTGFVILPRFGPVHLN